MMKPLFKHPQTIVRKLRGNEVLYAFDFDGTLARLVRRPHAAKLSPSTRKLLKELSAYGHVVVITGRSVRDLRSRLGLKLRHVVGNHGLESDATDRACLLEAKHNTRIWKRALTRALGKDAEKALGIEVEDKKYSLAVHYRLARHRNKTRALLAEAIATLKPPPRVVGGKSIFNLVQPDAPHKGAALLGLMKALKSEKAVYVGDDDTDEDVFGLADRRITSIRVGKKAQSRAQYYLDRQSEMNRLLKLLIDSAEDARA